MLKGYDYLLDDELAVYNALYQSGNTDKAAAYLEALSPELLQRRADVLSAKSVTYASAPILGALQTAKTFITNPFASAATHLGALFGQSDANAPIYDLQRDVSDIRQTRGDLWGDWLSWEVFGQPIGSIGYNVFTSIGDMAVAKGVGGAIAGATGSTANFAKGAMQFVMSSEASASTIQNDLEKGWSPDAALLHGVGNGLIEAWTERGFMDKLFSDEGTFLYRVLSSGAAEGLEEIEAGSLQILSDIFVSGLAGKQNEIEQTYAQYRQQGMSKEEASRATLVQFMQQIAVDGLSGFASGAGLSAGTNTVQHVQDANAGKALQNDGNVQGVISIAEGLDINSEAYKQGVTIRDRIAAGKKVSNAEFGRLITAVAREIGTENSGALMDVYDQAITDRLVELGDDAEQAKKNAPVIRRIAMGEKITRAERAALEWTDNASTVTKELTATSPVFQRSNTRPQEATRYQTEQSKQVDAVRFVQRQVPEAVMRATEEEGYRAGQSWVTKADQTYERRRAKSFATSMRFSEALTTKETATETKQDVAARAEERGNAMYQQGAKLRPREISYQEDGEEVSGEFVKVTKRGKNFFVELNIADREETVEVKMEDVSGVGDAGLGAVFAAAQESDYDMTAEQVNIMVAAYEKYNGPVGDFIRGFDAAYRAGYAGAEMVSDGIDPQLAEIAYQQGKAEAEADEASRIAAADPGKRIDTPIVTYLGEVASDADVKGMGTEEALEKRFGKMTKSQKLVTEFARELAKKTGINFVLFESQADEEGRFAARNGSYDSAAHTIYLDINSGINTAADKASAKRHGTLGDAMMRTIGHEVTHAIEATAPEAYAKYKAAVKAELAARNENWNELVNMKLRRAIEAGRKLSLKGAEAEVIADASEYMLQDSKFVKSLSQDTASRIKQIIKDFVNKINEVFRNLTGGHRESLALREMRDGMMRYSQTLQDLWDAGFDVLAGDSVEMSVADGGAVAVEETAPAKASMELPLLDPRVLDDVDGGMQSDALDIVAKMQTPDGQSYSLRSMTEDYDIYREMLIKHGSSKEEIDALYKVIDRTMQLVNANRDILDFGMNVGRDQRSFTPVKPNSDSLYKVSVDFSTLCRKRLLQQTVQERLEQKYNTVLTKAERVAIRNELMKLREDGKKIEIACALCYVESARLKSPAQIQRFFDDQRGVLVEYFSKKNKAYQAEINKMADDMIVGYGYESGTPKNALNTSQKKAVEAAKKRMYKAYKPSADEESIIDTALSLSPESYRTEKGLWRLKKEHPEIFDAYTSYIRNATKSKGIEGDEAWWAGDSSEISDTLIEQMNAENGLRSQSWSDFQVIHLLDYIAAIIELSTRNAKMQTYTKVTEFVRLMGKTGVMINLSLIPKGFDGTLNYDPIEGMPIEEALKLRDDYPDTVGTICIGITDEHIRMLLADENTDYVIPYHSSSLDKKTRQAMGMKAWDDFQSVQNEKKKDYKDTEEDSPNYHKAPRFSDWFDYDTVAARAKEVGAEQAMREAAERYKDICHKRGLEEKFAKFATEDNYWKLLIDRKMINHKTGEIIKQNPVKPVFDMDAIEQILAAEVKRYKDHNADFEDAARHIEEMWENGQIRKAANSKVVRNTVKAFEDSLIVRNIVEASEDTQHSDRDQTDTPAFKRWFDGSKVVNADGSPKVMYHGTNADEEFTVFNTYGSRFGLFGVGSYFTDNPDVAQGYTRKGRGSNPRVYQVYLSIKNPLDMDAPFDSKVWLTDDEEYNEYFAGAQTNQDGFRALKEYCADQEMYAWEASEYILETIEGAGHDGITHIGGGRYNRNDQTRHRVYIAFNPEQIKSATDNVGTFDPGNADIRYSERDIPSEVSVREYLAASDDSVTSTIEERNAFKTYQERLQEHAQASDAVAAAEEALKTASDADRAALESQLRAARVRQQKLFKRLTAVENTPHVQAVVTRTSEFISKQIQGKSRNEIAKMIESRERRIAKLQADFKGLKGAAKTQRSADIRAVQREIAMLRSNATEMVAKKNQQIADLRERKNRQLADLRERKDRQINDIHSRNKMTSDIETKANHIRTVVNKLNDRLTKEEDYKNVKEPLKPVVREVVRTFIDGFGSLVFDKTASDALKVVYDRMAAADSEAEHLYDEDVSMWLDELAVLAEADQTRREVDTYHLPAVEKKLYIYTRVAEIADHIYHIVTNADQAFLEGRRASIALMAAEVGSGLLNRKDKATLVGAARTAVNTLDDLLRTGNLTPQYFFESLKNGGLMSLFDGLMDGQRKYGKAVFDGKRFVEQTKKKYNYYKWGHSRKPMMYTTHQGHQIGLTIEQALWVYATAKREATNTLTETKHLEEGGFRYETKDLPREKWYKAHKGSDGYHKLNAADVAAIGAMLSDEQKAYADEMVRYLSEDCAAQGNQASLALFGIKKYNEEYYFPFRTASEQLHQKSDAGAAPTTNDARLKHASYTHALRKGANTPLVMSNFSDVVGNHINQMATYSSFVLPIETMNRVLNRKVNEDAEGKGAYVSIRSLIGRKYGESAQKYIADLLKDLNGGPQTDNRGSISGLFRAFKRGAVLGSLSVAVQQPTAIVRAFAFVKPRYFTTRGHGLGRDAWNRIMQYSGTAVVKDMGRFDVGMGRMADDWIVNGDTGLKLREHARFLLDTKGFNAIKNRFVEFATSTPGFFDRITWTMIWNAVEAEQAEQHPDMDHNSDAFLRIVGERFDDVVNHTQVYDSILAKSQNMRSKNALTQMSTAFMSEPTLNANLYYSAATGNHSAGKRAGIVASVIASNLLAALLAAAVSAWNKDDDKRTFAEKYVDAFASRAVDNLNPMTMLPYLADLHNILSGYDVERTDWSVIKEIKDAGSTMINKTNKGERVTWKNVEDFAGNIANLTGIPLRNWSRNLRRLRNLLFYTDFSAPTNLSLTMLDSVMPDWLYDSSKKAYMQRLVTAAADGDTQEAVDLHDYLTESLKASQDSMESNIRSDLKERVQSGTMTPEQATAILRKYVPYKSDKNNIDKPKEWLEEKDD